MTVNDLGNDGWLFTTGIKKYKSTEEKWRSTHQIWALKLEDSTNILSTLWNFQYVQWGKTVVFPRVNIYYFFSKLCLLLCSFNSIISHVNFYWKHLFHQNICFWPSPPMMVLLTFLTSAHPLRWGNPFLKLEHPLNKGHYSES